MLTNLAIAPASQAGTASYDSTVLGTSGLVSYWKLAEASGTTAADSKGTNTGTYQGTNTLGQTGIPGSTDTADQLDGSTAYISTTTSGSIPSTFSMECWFKTTTTSGGGLAYFSTTQVGTGTPSNANHFLFVDNSGKVVFDIYSGSAWVSIASASTYRDGNWHHAVATLDSTAGMALYVDGASVGTNANTAHSNMTGWWRISDIVWGTEPDSPTSPFLNGTIGQVALYNVALSSATVSSHYSAGSSAASGSAIAATGVARQACARASSW